MDAETKKARAAGVTASDIAAICGLSKVKTALQVYTEKVAILDGVVVEELESEDIDRGIFLEDGCRKWYAKKKGLPIDAIAEPGLLRHPEFSWAMATPDGIVMEPGARWVRGLEIKNPGIHSSFDWGDPDEGDVPLDHLCQSVWGMFVTGLREWDLAAPLGGKLVVYPIRWDEELATMLIERAGRFYGEHLMKRVPPPPTGLEIDVEIIKKKFPSNLKPMFGVERLDESDRELVKLVADAHKQKKAWETQFDQLANSLKLIIGEHEGIDLGDAGKITWKKDRDSVKDLTDWEAVAIELYMSLRNKSLEEIRATSLADLAKKHTKPTITRQGARKFCVRMKGEE